MVIPTVKCSSQILYIPETQTKWTPSCRRHIQMHFREWQLPYFRSNITEIWSQRPHWQYASIASGNGLAPNRLQAIIWTNEILVYWHIYTSLCLDELNVTKKPMHMTHYNETKLHSSHSNFCKSKDLKQHKHLNTHTYNSTTKRICIIWLY